MATISRLRRQPRTAGHLFFSHHHRETALVIETKNDMIHDDAKKEVGETFQDKLKIGSKGTPFHGVIAMIFRPGACFIFLKNFSQVDGGGPSSLRSHERCAGATGRISREGR